MTIYQTQTAAARAIGVGQATISRWIDGGVLPAKRVAVPGSPKGRFKIAHSDLETAARTMGVDLPTPNEKLDALLETVNEDQGKAFDVLVRHGGFSGLKAARLLKLSIRRKRERDTGQLELTLDA